MSSILKFHSRITLIACIFIFLFRWDACQAQLIDDEPHKLPTDTYEPEKDEKADSVDHSKKSEEPAAMPAVSIEPKPVAAAEPRKDVVISVKTPAADQTGAEDEQYKAFTNRVGATMRSIREVLASESSLQGGSLAGMGKLQELERKKFESNNLRIEIARRDEQINKLLETLAETMGFIERQNELLKTVKEKKLLLADQILELEGKLDTHKKTLDLLRLGDFEYYEVKEGDTCRSIAANPLIYNEASKEQYIRQANRGHIEDLDSLVPGQMLIIPRFPASGRYEF
jgi:hypothetical protein